MQKFHDENVTKESLAIYPFLRLPSEISLENKIGNYSKSLTRNLLGAFKEDLKIFKTFDMVKQILCALICGGCKIYIWLTLFCHKI